MIRKHHSAPTSHSITQIPISERFVRFSIAFCSANPNYFNTSMRFSRNFNDYNTYAYPPGGGYPAEPQGSCDPQTTLMTSMPLRPNPPSATMSPSWESVLPRKHFSPFWCLTIRADKGWPALTNPASRLRAARKTELEKRSRVRLGQRLILGSRRDRACN